ncbi:hypothetical protein AURDEDRAFT_169908 [Auricularia subglabra TFB-10046 SS5]|uniref:Uncharacterized protein n=1 Tax=Auricularia subglabra (strain TFB-10046 / SS5) TaxID=717982 RepID=J0DCZ7_AURST|nr:hypothetical protein AURDEDRAFT_169908 [Auricularia subglabra TFB-10046 SS5]
MSPLKIPVGPGPEIFPLTRVVQDGIEALITAGTVSIPEQQTKFDEAFNNLFSRSVEATINGQHKSRDELRKFLLDIRGSLNGETADFQQLIEYNDGNRWERTGEVATFFEWEGFRPFLILGAPQAVKANVSLQASVRLEEEHSVITCVSVVAQEVPVPIKLGQNGAA